MSFSCAEAYPLATLRASLYVPPLPLPCGCWVGEELMAGWYSIWGIWAAGLLCWLATRESQLPLGLLWLLLESS